MATRAKKEISKKDSELDEKEVTVKEKVEDTSKDQEESSTVELSSKKESMTREEIKDLVEDTVDEALKEQEEKEEKEDSVEDKMPTPSSENKPPEEKKSDEPVLATGLGEAENAHNIESSEKSGEVISSQEQPTVPIEGAQQSSMQNPVISVSGVSAGGETNNSSVLSSQPTQKKKSPLILLFIVFVICGLLAGLGVLFLLSKNNVQIPPIPFINQPTPTTTQINTPTPAPQDVSVADVKIRILNGSGVSGAAAAAKTDLVAAGFTVDSIGNSPKDTSDTTIAAKPTVGKSVLTKLVEVLNKKYTVAENTSSLDASESADIVVTIGKAK